MVVEDIGCFRHAGLNGAGNYVHSNWTWFTCWRCGALNYM